MRQRASGNCIAIVGDRVGFSCSSQSSVNLSLLKASLVVLVSTPVILPSGIDLRYLSQRLASLRSAASFQE